MEKLFSFNLVETNKKSIKFIDDFSDLFALILKDTLTSYNTKIHSLNDSHYVLGIWLNNEYLYIDIYGIWRQKDLNYCISDNLIDLSHSEVTSEIVTEAKYFSKVILDYIKTL